MTEMNGTETLLPAFRDEGVAVVFATDANYAPYLAAAIVSLIRHASQDRLYDIIVFHAGLNEDNIAKLTGLASGHSNIYVRHLNIKATIDEAKTKYGGMPFGGHLSEATYYRLFVTLLLPEYQKVVFLDSDIILLFDVANLFDVDLRGKPVAAARDIIMAAFWGRGLKDRRLADVAHGKASSYLNTGCMVMDLEMMRRENIEEKFLDRLPLIAPWSQFPDQDIINATLSDNVTYLDQAWNSYTGWLDAIGKTIQPDELPNWLYQEYLQAGENAKLLHYITPFKPWHLPHLLLADKFWECAKETPYYEQLRENAIKYLFDRQDQLGKALLPLVAPRLKRCMAFNALLAKLTHGDRRKVYLQRVEAAQKEYRALTRERYAPRSRFLQLLRGFLGL